jgi:hypothetical protein
VLTIVTVSTGKVVGDVAVDDEVVAGGGETTLAGVETGGFGGGQLVGAGGEDPGPGWFLISTIRAID